MKHLIGISSLVLGSLLCCTFQMNGDDKGESKPKPKLTRTDFDGLMKSLSNWGRWGDTDELGTLNFITAEKRKSAAALVKDGVSVSMARTLAQKGASGADAQAFSQRMLSIPKGGEFSFASDEYRVAYHGFTLTHMDSLCHVFYKGRMYNGFSQSEVDERGAAKMSVANVKQGIFTRAVLMDIPRLLGVKYLEGGYAIYPEQLEAWEKIAGVKVESGDAVLIHTGRWARERAAGSWDIMTNSAGLHASCLKWLKDRDVAIVGSDLALDVLPSGVEGVELPVHVIVLVAMGMPILDNCDYDAVSGEAAKRKRWSFLLTVAPLAVDGGTGSPVNPLATF